MITKITTKLFGTKSINWIESRVIYFSIVAMFFHILVIFLAKSNFIDDPYLAGQTYLEVISTPFTIILIYEIFLLVVSVSKSMSISIGKQYEIIALVLIRDVFKVISSYQYTSEQPIQPDLLITIGFDIFFAILAFILIGVYYYHQRNCSMLLEKQDQDKDLIKTKSIGSLFLVGAFLISLFIYIIELTQSADSKEFFNSFKEISFLPDLFVIMVIIDIVLLLMTFNKSHSFKDIFYEAVLIISSIVVRFAFIASAPLNGILSVVGISIGLFISILYSKWSRLLNV